MPIKPFDDIPNNPIGTYVNKLPEVDDGSATSWAGTTISGSMPVRHKRFLQGVSVYNMDIYGRKLIPMVGGENFGYRIIDDQGVNHDQVKTDFGQPKFFKDPGQIGPKNAFEDIAGKFTGLDYLTAPDTQIYPSVLTSEVFITPAAFDGVIEPLTVRGKMNITNSEGPFNVYDIRADIFILKDRGAIEGGSPDISQFYRFDENEDATSTQTFIDASDTILTWAVPGISDFNLREINPFVDSTELDASYNPFPELTLGVETQIDGFGVYTYSSAAGYYYSNNSVARSVQEDLKTGGTFVHGTDSIAYGGLRR